MVKMESSFSGSHGNEYEDDSLLGCCAIGAVSTSETLISIYQTTWCNIAEDSHLQRVISRLI
jgi:hypothetical protein